MPPGPPGPPASTCRCLGLFLDFGHQSFGGEHQARDGRGVLQRQTGNLGWVDDAGLNQVNVFAGVGVEAVVFVLGVADLADHNRAFKAGVECDLAEQALPGRA